MKQILPHALWLGDLFEDAHFRRVFDAGIKALVYVAAEEAPPTPPRELIWCRFPLLDGVGNRAELLYLAVSTVSTLLKLHVPTMVCGAGASRSPAVAAAALAMLHQQAPDECLKRVVEHYPCDISPGFWAEVTGLLRSMR